jgi:hypothetical protein
MLTKHVQGRVPKRFCLGRQHEGGRFGRQVLGAGGIAEGTPGRHYLAAWASDARIGIVTGCHSEFSRAGFVCV